MVLYLVCFITAEKGGVTRAKGEGEKEKECTTERKSRRRRDEKASSRRCLDIRARRVCFITAEKGFTSRQSVSRNFENNSKNLLRYHPTFLVIAKNLGETALVLTFTSSVTMVQNFFLVNPSSTQSECWEVGSSSAVSRQVQQHHLLLSLLLVIHGATGGWSLFAGVSSRVWPCASFCRAFLLAVA